MIKEKQRIAKVIARAGIASRREAEEIIVQGRVMVNGKMLHTPAFLVSDEDEIIVDDVPLKKPEQTKLYRFYKPRGYLTTRSDDRGRDTIIDILPKEYKNLISVGRLDYNSEGLLLMTNDGELARKLTLPANGWIRRYKVRVFGTPSPDSLAKLKKGITIDDVKYRPVDAEIMSQQGANSWLIITLSEGKNREIRTIMEYFNHPVSRLIRLSFGPFQLGNLQPGAIEPINNKILKEQLGKIL